MTEPLPDFARKDYIGPIRYASSSGRQLEAIRRALFNPEESDISHNLQGALYDLQNQFNPRDGGVCARTVERVIERIEKARTILECSPPEAAPLETSLWEARWRTGTRNALKDGNLNTIGDLLAATRAELLRIPNLGRGSLSEIERYLAVNGHCLQPPPRWMLPRPAA